MKKTILSLVLSVALLATLFTALPVFATAAPEHFTAIYQAEGSLVEPQRNTGITSLTADGITIAAGTNGNAVWGPYIALEPGATKITFRIKCPDVTFGGATGVGDNEWLVNLAIYNPLGEAIATTEAAGKYLPQFLAGEYINFEFNFIAATAGNYNPVIYTTGKKALFLDSITYDGYKAGSTPEKTTFTGIYQAEDNLVTPYRAGTTSITADGLTIAAAAGNAIWGPYVALPVGEAKVTFRMRCPDVTFGGATGVGDNEWLANLAIYNPLGEAIATDEAAGKYLPQFLAGEYVNFEFNFTAAAAGTYNPVIYTTGKKELVLDCIIMEVTTAAAASSSSESTPEVTPTEAPVFTPIDTSAYPVVYDFQGIRDDVGGYPRELQSNMYFFPDVQFTTDGIVVPAGNARNFIWGPYVNNFAAGDSFWTFRLKIDDIVPTDENIDSRFLRLVVQQQLPGGDFTEFKSIDDVYIDDFKANDTYQNFTIEVPITAGAVYTCAVYSAGFKVVTMNSLTIDDSMPEEPVDTTTYPVVYDFQGKREDVGGYPHEIRSNMYFFPDVEFTADGIVVPAGNARNFVWGPYVSTFPAGDTFWVFRIKIDDIVPTDENIDSRFLRLVVLQQLPGGDFTEFKSIDDVYIDDFQANDTYQDFIIEVPITAGGVYTCAVYSAGFKLVTMNSLTITDVDPSTSSEEESSIEESSDVTSDGISDETSASEDDESPVTGDSTVAVILAVLAISAFAIIVSNKRKSVKAN